MDIKNKQVFKDYFIEETYQAGIQLLGCEIKSIRAGNANLKGSFVKIQNAEAYVYNVHIMPYEFTLEQHDPVRPRKLLLHKKEIDVIWRKLEQKGYSLLPLKIYFIRGFAKLEIGLGKGKKHYDKRSDIKKKETNREIARELKHRNR
ncbi:MAG: SsrA-binding protein SmpB [Candidatus Omnitrophica bacterium]|nr:SsrA-binding protein SmpB [Candidatus Omnitrophota bacterium]